MSDERPIGPGSDNYGEGNFGDPEQDLKDVALEILRKENAGLKAKIDDRKGVCVYCQSFEVLLTDPELPGKMSDHVVNCDKNPLVNMAKEACDSAQAAMNERDRLQEQVRELLANLDALSRHADCKNEPEHQKPCGKCQVCLEEQVRVLSVAGKLVLQWFSDAGLDPDDLISEYGIDVAENMRKAIATKPAEGKAV